MSRAPLVLFFLALVFSLLAMSTVPRSVRSLRRLPIGIDQAYYINLRRRKDRDAHMQQQLTEAGLAARRFDAVDGHRMPIEQALRHVTASSLCHAVLPQDHTGDGTVSLGALGCIASHCALYREMIDKNMQRCLILEDDVHLCPDFVERLERLLANLPAHEGMVFLGYHNTVPTPSGPPNAPETVLRPRENIFGFFGYVITRSVAQWFLERLPFPYQLDTVSGHIWEAHHYLPVIVTPPLVRSYGSHVNPWGTDIQHISVA